jgi:hypothetical protein
MTRVTTLLAIVLCVGSVALAQSRKKADEDKFRTVQGLVTDANDTPVVGAVVQLKNTKTLQIRSFITQDRGTFLFHGLDPNIDYSLRAEYQGASSPERVLSSFDTRRDPVVNLKVEGKK